jgi:PAS domain S-box-containing protein
MWVRGEAIFDNNYKIIGLWGAAQDITERKHNEELLQDAKERAKESAEKYRLLHENAGLGIGYYSPEGVVISYNKIAAKHLNGKPEDFTGKSIFDLFPKSDAEFYFNRIKQAINSSEPNLYEDYVQLPNEEKWFLSAFTKIVDSKNKVIGIQIISNDITKLKSTELELIKAKEKTEESEARLLEAQKATKVGSWETDLSNFKVIWSEETYRIFDLNPDIFTASHQAFMNFVHPEDKEIVDEAFVKSFGTKAYNSVEHRIITAKDAIKFVVERWKIVFDEHGNPTRAIGTCQDITELKHAVLELNEAKEKAEESEAKLIIQNSEIELNNNRLESLLKISQFQTNSLQELLDFALNEAVQLTSSKIGYIYFYKEENKQFILNTWSKDVMQECAVMEPQTVYDLDSTGCWGEAVRQRKPIIINDYQADNPLKSGTPEGHVKLEKFLTIPVIVDNKIVAVAGVANKLNDYDNSDIRQLSLLMDSVWKISERILLIKDLTKAKEKAEESEERFNLAMNASNDGLFDWNLETNQIYYSPGWKKMLGYDENELPNDFSVWENNVEPEDLKKSWEQHQKLISKQIDRFVMEFKMKHKDGYLVDILSRAEAFFNEDGKAVRMIGTHTDITQRKRADEKIIQQNEFLKNVMASLTHPFYVVDINDYTIKMANPASGYNLDLNKTTCHALTHNTDVPCNKSNHPCPVEIIKKTLKPTMVEHIHIDEAGNRKNMEIHGYPVFDKSGNIEQIIEYSLDITERKKAEDALLRSEAKLSALFSSMSEMVVLHELVFDNEGNPVDYRITDCNEAFTRITGITRENAVGRLSTEVFGITNPPYIKEYTFVALTGKPYNYETYFLPMDKYFSISVVSPEMNHFATVTNDITEHKRAELLLQDKSEEIAAQNEELHLANIELNEAKEKAEESDKLKTAFLQNMSHEIRTPLNGILGFSSLLHDDNLEKEEIKEYTEIISQSGRRLQEIINNVLDISKIETGQMILHNSTFSVNSMISKLFSFFSPSAEAKDIKLYFKSSLDNTNCQIISDETKLNQILNNLINNAIKFTNEGSIDFGYELDNKELKFYVKDTGIGIPAEYKNKIFERFTQVDLEITRGYEGAGLGLAISKGLVEMLGGRMWFDTEFGKGTTFYFTIPYTHSTIVTNEIITIEMEDKLTKKINILIAEDDYISYIYLSKVLKASDYNLILAENGQLAVDIIKTNPDINLVLMDIRMPVMDGYAATKQIKSIRPDLPIIAQTAYAFNEEREKILTTGCDDYLSKPIDKEKLLQIINQSVNM